MNKRHVSRSICTENFDNLFIQDKNWLRSRVQQLVTSSMSLLISPCNNDSCFFFIFETLFANETPNFSCNQNVNRPFYRYGGHIELIRF